MTRQVEDQQTVTQQEQCPNCKGTGLYAGMGERLGAAVMCRKCKGTGMFEHQFVPFSGKQPPPGNISRVYAHNPSDGAFIITPEVPGGVPIQEWQQNPDSTIRPGAEIRTICCPSWWFMSTVTQKEQPVWPECVKTSPFMDCPMFAQKQQCWQKLDLGRAEQAATA